MRSHGAELYRFAYRLIGDDAAAEDLVQETFYEAWRGMGGLRERDKARPWLFQILRRRALRWRRRRQRDRDREASAAEAARAAIHPDNDLAGRIERVDQLQRALDRMDESLVTPLLMVFVEGLTCREASLRLDLPLGTVLSRIHRAKRKLRVLLTERRDDTNHTRADSDASRSLRLSAGGES